MKIEDVYFSPFMRPFKRASLRSYYRNQFGTEEEYLVYEEKSLLNNTLSYWLSKVRTDTYYVFILAEPQTDALFKKEGMLEYLVYKSEPAKNTNYPNRKAGLTTYIFKFPEGFKHEANV